MSLGNTLKDTEIFSEINNSSGEDTSSDNESQEDNKASVWKKVSLGKIALRNKKGQTNKTLSACKNEFTNTTTQETQLIEGSIEEKSMEHIKVLKQATNKEETHLDGDPSTSRKVNVKDSKKGEKESNLGGKNRPNKRSSKEETYKDLVRKSVISGIFGSYKKNNNLRVDNNERNDLKRKHTNVDATEVTPAVLSKKNKLSSVFPKVYSKRTKKDLKCNWDIIGTKDKISSDRLICLKGEKDKELICNETKKLIGNCSGKFVLNNHRTWDKGGVSENISDIKRKEKERLATISKIFCNYQGNEKHNRRTDINSNNEITSSANVKSCKVKDPSESKISSSGFLIIDPHIKRSRQQTKGKQRNSSWKPICIPTKSSTYVNSRYSQLISKTPTRSKDSILLGKQSISAHKPKCSLSSSSDDEKKTNNVDCVGKYKNSFYKVNRSNYQTSSHSSKHKYSLSSSSDEESNIKDDGVRKSQGKISNSNQSSHSEKLENSLSSSSDEESKTNGDERKSKEKISNSNRCQLSSHSEKHKFFLSSSSEEESKTIDDVVRKSQEKISNSNNCEMSSHGQKHKYFLSSSSNEESNTNHDGVRKSQSSSHEMGESHNRPSSKHIFFLSSSSDDESKDCGNNGMGKSQSALHEMPRSNKCQISSYSSKHNYFHSRSLDDECCTSNSNCVNKSQNPTHIISPNGSKHTYFYSSSSDDESCANVDGVGKSQKATKIQKSLLSLQSLTSTTSGNKTEYDDGKISNSTIVSKTFQNTYLSGSLRNDGLETVKNYKSVDKFSDKFVGLNALVRGEDNCISKSSANSKITTNINIAEVKSLEVKYFTQDKSPIKSNQVDFRKMIHISKQTLEHISTNSNSSDTNSSDEFNFSFKAKDTEFSPKDRGVIDNNVSKESNLTNPYLGSSSEDTEVKENQSSLIDFSIDEIQDNKLQGENHPFLSSVSSKSKYLHGRLSRKRKAQRDDSQAKVAKIDSDSCNSNTEVEKTKTFDVGSDDETLLRSSAKKNLFSDVGPVVPLVRLTDCTTPTKKRRDDQNDKENRVQSPNKHKNETTPQKRSTRKLNLEEHTQSVSPAKNKLTPLKLAQTPTKKINFGLGSYEQSPGTLQTANEFSPIKNRSGESSNSKQNSRSASKPKVDGELKESESKTKTPQKERKSTNKERELKRLNIDCIQSFYEATSPVRSAKSNFRKKATPQKHEDVTEDPVKTPRKGAAKATEKVNECFTPSRNGNKLLSAARGTPSSPAVRCEVNKKKIKQPHYRDSRRLSPLQCQKRNQEEDF